MLITAETIETVAQAQELRVLRNECAEWMTRDTSEIDPQRQARFYRKKIATGVIKGFLLRRGPEAVAYGLLVPDADGRVWSSTGVKADYRGNGYGRMVTVENARRAHAMGVPIWAEVRRDNTGQQRICYTAGYRLMNTLERGGMTVDILRCDKLPPEYT